MENADTETKQVHPVNDVCLTTGNYAALHAEITLVAYLLTRERESARDLASECLLAGWQQLTDKEMVTLQLLRQVALQLINALYQNLLKCNQLQMHAEFTYWQQDMEQPATDDDIREKQEAILYLSQRLEPMEQQIVIWNLVHQWTPEEIALLLAKPVNYIKNIRNRAVFYLKRHATKYG